MLLDKLKQILANLQELSGQNISEIFYGSPHFTGIQNCIYLGFVIILWIPKDLLALYFNVELFAFIKTMTGIFSLFV